MPAENRRGTHLNRRQALRMGGAIGAAAAGIAAALRGPGSTPAPAQAQASAWRTMHLEGDAVVGDPVSITLAGSGPPQKGDWFSVTAQLYDADKTDGPQVGVYQCFGSWTAAATDTGGPDQRFTSVQFHWTGRGAIMGIINEGGAEPGGNVGAVQGGTGEFLGAHGSFRQVNLTGNVAGVNPGAAAFRGSFDLMIPNLGATVSQSGR